MWKEFKEFAVKGNAIDLAVGVIIGAAFGKIVTSIVEDSEESRLPRICLRQFHHRLDQFPNRRLLHFSGGESDQQIEAPQPVGRACSERLPGLRHVNPDQGNALSALHE